MRGMDGGLEKDDDDQYEAGSEDIDTDKVPATYGASLNLNHFNNLNEPDYHGRPTLNSATSFTISPSVSTKQSAIEKLRERVENFSLFPEEGDRGQGTGNRLAPLDFGQIGNQGPYFDGNLGFITDSSVFIGEDQNPRSWQPKRWQED